MKKLFTLLCGLIAFAGVMAQTKLIEKVDKVPGKLIIPYEKYQLPNGLTVVVHEDHSNPIVHVEVTYHVGSAREVKDRTGFAHFFEHMMFQGSGHVQDEEHFKIVSGAGGNMNGSTNRDRTNYFETLPANYLEMALWLESDRMGFLLDSVTQKKFEVQRATVKNEKGQNVENVPYGIVEEYLNANLYPEGHPYSWTTIGYTQDLDRATVEDLKNFFLRWYGPNNAVLVISGDVKTTEALALVEKYFGSIPQCPKVNKMKVERVVLPERRFVKYSEKVPYPLYTIVYPTVGTYQKDEAALDILANILGNGNNSIFYKHFEKNENALQANCYNRSEELAGEFTLRIIPYYGTPIDSIDAWLKASFDELEKNGISDEAMERAKSVYLTQFIRGMESVAGKSTYLNYWSMFLNKPFNMQDEIDRYKNVTKEQVMAAYNNYIKNKPAVWVQTQPKYSNPDETKKTETITNTEKVVPPNEYNNLSYKKPVDNFDRSKHPIPGEVKSVQFPNIYNVKFDNGLRVAGTVNNEVPLVYLQLSIKGGELHEMNDLKKIGLCSVTSELMNEGTQKYTSEEFSAQLEKMGSSIYVSSSSEEITISMQCRAENVDATLKLFEERLLHTKFNKDDFKRTIKSNVEQAKGLDYNAGLMSQLAFGKLMYGNNPYGLFANEKSYKSITLEDVNNFYNNNFSPSISNLIIVGSIGQEEMMPKLGFLKEWSTKPVTIPSPGEFYETEGTKIYLVDKPEAPQSSLVIGFTSDKYSATGRFFKNTIMNYQLGGSFNSRLNQDIREDKGYTYGIRSGYNFNNYMGYYTIGCSVRGTATDSALEEIMKVVKEYKTNGPTDEEVAFTRSSMLNARQMRYETTGSMASFIGNMLDYGITPEVLKEQEKIISTISRTELAALAKDNLKTDKMIIMVVGDKDSLKKRLEKLNMGEVKVYNSTNDVQFNPKNRVALPLMDKKFPRQ
ncbi:MAG: pitrilysin family protein [Bacteroidota bacterium]|nr:pitrilysin family protein [Bacteroidota bacterium]